MGHIQRHHLNDARVVVPPPDLLDAMNRSLSPLLEGQWRRWVESRTLGKVRDTLLPKLMSGELRVKDAERFVEDRLRFRRHKNRYHLGYHSSIRPGDGSAPGGPTPR
jgi:hypothetical protein